MNNLLTVITLLKPFFKEFGLKDIDLKTFINKNKFSAYATLIAILLTCMVVYSTDQAQTRMINNLEVKDELIDLQKQNQHLTELLSVYSTSSNKKPDKTKPKVIDSSDEDVRAEEVVVTPEQDFGEDKLIDSLEE